MKVCGICLKASNAIFTILEGDRESYSVVETTFRKVTLDNKSKKSESVNSFAQTIQNFFNTHEFDRIAIKERFERGPYKGGAVSFKMEALIQSSGYDVELIHPATLSTFIKKVDIDYSNSLAYQKESYQIAYFLLPVKND